MVKNSVTATVGICMVLTMIALWLRVRTLEESVRQLQSQQSVRVVPVQVPAPLDVTNKKQQIFRLIDSPESYAEPEEGPFHPDVDRAMMIDAIQTTPSAVDPVEESSVQNDVQPDSRAFSIPDLQSLPDSIEPFRKSD